MRNHVGLRDATPCATPRGNEDRARVGTAELEVPDGTERLGAAAEVAQPDLGMAMEAERVVVVLSVDVHAADDIRG